MANTVSPLISNVEAQKMLHGIASWETPDVASFLKEVEKILARKKEKRLSKEETALFLIINKAVLTPEEWQTYTILHAKYEAESISSKEQAKLDRFVKKLEKYGLKRLKALIKLAQIRNTSLDKLMLELGIRNITPDVTEKTKR